MTKVIWQGVVENTAINIDHPMRVVEDAEGKLMTEWAADTEDGDGNIVFNENSWYADYQKTFRLMTPSPSEELRLRMIEQQLLDD